MRAKKRSIGRQTQNNDHSHHVPSTYVHSEACVKQLAGETPHLLALAEILPLHILPRDGQAVGLDKFSVPRPQRLLGSLS
jgi:hypothetical protein